MQNNIIRTSSPALLLSNTKPMNPLRPPTPIPKPPRPPRRLPYGPSSVSYFFVRTISPSFHGHATREVSVACSFRGRPWLSVRSEKTPEVYVCLGRGKKEREKEKGWMGTITDPTAPIPAPRWAGAASLTAGTSGPHANGNGGG